MKVALGIALLLSCASVSPASAQVVGSTNVDVTNSTTFTFGGNSFIFDFDPAAAASFSPGYFVQTTGTAQTTAVFGQPSPFDTRGTLFDGNTFPSYASIPSLTVIPYSQVMEDLGLRYAIGADYYYGYARLNGNGTLDIGFQSQPNVGINGGAAITAALPGAVPEPGTWAMMLVGFGAIGFAMRRRNRENRLLATA